MTNILIRDMISQDVPKIYIYKGQVLTSGNATFQLRTSKKRRLPKTMKMHMTPVSLAVSFNSIQSLNIKDGSQ